MADALYGPHGFYRAHRPEAHFRTSVAASPLFASAVARLADRVDRALGWPEPFDVVDVGAGDGSLLAAVHHAIDDRRRSRWRLHAVELRPRPDGLPSAVRWGDQPPPRVAGLVLAHELLDNVPLDVVELAEGRLRVVEVDTQGRERLGGDPDPEDASWLAQWWPMDGASDGDRAEVGRTRDVRWVQLVRTVDRGVAVAVDYAHTRAERASGRWPAGTLTGYREGRQVVPVPDGSCDLTAHVALDACAGAGRAAGAADSVLTDQRTVLSLLGVNGTRPPLALAHSDPAGYVRALSAASQAGELLQRGGLGDFGWLLQARGCSLSDVLRTGV
jgi:SAM-dependent MidA family methyltransferase